MRVSNIAFHEVEQALRVYEKEVDSSSLEDSTKRTYLMHSANFARWLKNDLRSGRKEVKEDTWQNYEGGH